MDDTPHAVSDSWPSPNPPLTAALIGSVLAGQGFEPQIDTSQCQPWRMVEFDRCSAWIESALKGGALSLAEVREGVRRGWFHLFHHPEGCMVAEFIFSPRLRAVHVFAAGGTLGAMRELTGAVEAFAREAGCNYGGATGRKGWVRFLKRFGYQPPSLSTVEKAF